jgi:putative sigma-54 modulation protein
MVRGRHVELTPSIREYAESKLGGMAGHLPDDVAVELELTEETHARHLAEATVFTKGQTLRASESGVSLRAAIDQLAANLERQVIRYREKRRDEPRRRSAHHGE